MAVKKGEYYVSSDRTEALESFEEVLGQKHYLGEWMVQRRKEHPAGGDPYIWKWSETMALLDSAGEVLNLEKGARRSLLFLNPGIPNGTTMMMRAGVQMMNPREVALAHRHQPNALRFVIDGSPDAFTVVNGEKLVMNTYDLILTPSFCWHHHENHGEHEVTWMDALDAALCSAVNVYFFEPNKGPNPKVNPEEDSMRHRVGWTRPAWVEAPENPGVGLPIAYPWAEVNEKLEHLRKAEGSPYDGIILEYVNPLTGGSALSTIDCHAQMLRPGEATRSHRHTWGTVYHVVQGSGTTTVGDTELKWEKGDHFVVPSWAWHEHKNNSSSEDAKLFSVSDAPVLQKLFMAREETQA